MYQSACQPVFKKVSPEEAKAFLAINDFPGQRPLKNQKVRQYVNKCKNGEMRAVSIAVAILSSGKRYLVNGQHCCHMILQLGKPFPAFVEYYRCETERDAWKLLSSFDVHPPRTEAQIMRAAWGTFESDVLRNAPRKETAAIASALFYVNAGKNNSPDFGATPEERTDKASALPNHVSEVAFILDVIMAEGVSRDERRVFARIGVFAAMISTFRVSPQAARVFWSSMIGGRNIDGVLRTAWNAVLTMPSKTAKMKGREASAYQYQRMIYYWNKWAREQAVA